MLHHSLWQPSKSALEMDKILMIDICFCEILVFLYVTRPQTWCYNSLKFSSALCMIKGFHSDSGDKCVRVSLFHYQAPGYVTGVFLISDDRDSDSWLNWLLLACAVNRAGGNHFNF